jgi:hypothetical protein
MEGGASRQATFLITSIVQRGNGKCMTKTGVSGDIELISSNVGILRSAN